LIKCCVAQNRVQQAAQLLLGLPRAARVHPDQLMYASVLPGLVSQGCLDMALDVFENLCGATMGDVGNARAPCIVTLGKTLFGQVARTGSAVQKDRAQNMLTAIRPTRALAPDQEMALSQVIRSSGWTGGEFVPGADFQEFVPGAHAWGNEFVPGNQWDMYQQFGYGEAAAEEAFWQATWAEGWQAPAITPLKAKTLQEGEQTSPNVMQILLQCEMGSGEKLSGKKVSPTKVTPTKTPTKSPLKMAPNVTKFPMGTNVSLSFNVPITKTPIRGGVSLRQPFAVSEENKEN